MSRPKIRLTMVDRLGPKGCHRGHKVGDSFDFDTERGQVCMAGGFRGSRRERRCSAARTWRRSMCLRLRWWRSRERVNRGYIKSAFSGRGVSGGYEM